MYDGLAVILVAVGSPVWAPHSINTHYRWRCTALEPVSLSAFPEIREGNVLDPWVQQLGGRKRVTMEMHLGEFLSRVDTTIDSRMVSKIFKNFTGFAACSSVVQNSFGRETVYIYCLLTSRPELCSLYKNRKPTD